MGARMVEQVFRNGTPVRLGPEDIVRSTDNAGPSFRLYWSSAMARDRATQQRSSTTELSRNRRGKGKQKDAAHHIPAMTSPGTDASGGGSTPVNMNDE